MEYRRYTEKANISQIDTIPEIAAQAILAEILQNANRPIMQLIQSSYSNNDLAFYSKVKQSVEKIITHFIGTLKKSNSEAQPILLDRLSFCWKLLRQADYRIWKLSKNNISQEANIEDARAAFHNLLPVQIEDSLLCSILQRLKIEIDAGHLYHYWCFRNWYIFKEKRTLILPRFFSSTHLSSDRSDLLRVIWWSILSIREQYVSDIGNEQVEIRFDYVVEKTFKDIKDSCGDEIIKIPDLASEIEGQLNEWIKYCHLESSDADNISQCELVKALINYYALDTKLLIKDIQQNPMYEARIRQLEEEIQQLATENKSLEKKLRQRDKKIQDAPEPKVSVLEQPSDGSSLAELRDFLKLIDSKYSFDTLNAIQSGQESPLTFRSFIAHLFYSLRKKGFGQYPQQDVFDLPYESSGLYECDGFEVPPGDTLKVQVAKRGWALQTKGRILPAKRARVTKVT